MTEGGASHTQRKWRETGCLIIVHHCIQYINCHWCMTHTLQIQGWTTMQIHGFLQFQNSLIIKYYVWIYKHTSVCGTSYHLNTLSNVFQNVQLFLFDCFACDSWWVSNLIFMHMKKPTTVVQYVCLLFCLMSVWCVCWECVNHIL